jgi:para-nitrobenzyl esterase
MMTRSVVMRSLPHGRVSVWAFLALLAGVPLSAAIVGPVRVDGGALAGATDSASGLSSFKAPGPPAKWDGVRQATKFSVTCMQTPHAEGWPYRTQAESMGEDCLYLNVWTGAKAATERRPVMVWIYGGALTRGAASLPGYDGSELAKKGVVLLSFNYRLGAFGFFAHPDLTAEPPHHSSGNYGFLDQIAALQWVRRNIAQFGGDPMASRTTYPH